MPSKPSKPKAKQQAPKPAPKPKAKPDAEAVRQQAIADGNAYGPGYD